MQSSGDPAQPNINNLIKLYIKNHSPEMSSAGYFYFHEMLFVTALLHPGESPWSDEFK